MSTEAPIYGGVEAGGTKFVCALGTSPDDLRAQTQFPTTTPEETLARTIAFFRDAEEAVTAIGIGSFGPVDLSSGSPTYGYITTTPKAGWPHTDFAGVVARALGVPVAFDTDVNAAAQGEHRWGAARNVETFIYMTIGTGVGGGALVDGRPVHGLVHPEMGHLLLPRAPGDTFEGACPFHGACLEGMASGPALAARWGEKAQNLPEDHQAWTFEAFYLALAIVNLTLTLSPQRIILGGGVMHQRHLFPMIRQTVQEKLNGYVCTPEILKNIERYIVPPALGDQAGVLGALAMAAKKVPQS
ncbi:MAG: ROK family protein [Rhodothermales bacterium]